MKFLDVYNLGFFHKALYEKVLLENDQFYFKLLDGKISFAVLLILGAVIASYLIGSLNFGIIISKFYGKDVRDGGSGNAGTTNMTRQFGKKAGVLTFIGDFLKALLMTIIGIMVFGRLGGLVAGLFCIIGHAFPIYFKFRGGKGVACVTAVVLLTSPISFFILMLIYAILIFGFKMVSFASVMTVLIYPFIIAKIEYKGLGPAFLVAMVISLLIIFLHIQNIVRIFNHTESKITFGNNNKNKENNNEDSKK